MAKKKEEGRERTRAFDLYEQGKNYNNSLVPNYYTLVDTNTEFYAGNQWVHLPQTPAMSRLPKPVFNIIKRVTSVLISQITSGGISVNLEPLSYYEGGPGSGDINPTEFAQAEITNLIEKLKLEYRIRDCMFDGALTGDYCMHFYWDPDTLPYGGASGEYRGEIKAEIVDGVNVMFGNPNNKDVQSQPYILLIGRDTVKNLRDEYLKQHPGDDDGADMIQSDAEYSEQVASGGKLELTQQENAKCLYIYLYEKVTTEEDMYDESGNPVMETETDSNGDPLYEKNDDDTFVMDMNDQPIPKKKKSKQMVTRVHVSKMTRSQTIFEDVDTELTYYPIAWGNWERQKNCYHGRALVTGVIPNQIFINLMWSMVMRHLQLEAFPKTVYNADLIGTFSNEIGQSIGIHGLQPGQAINQVAANLLPPDMSNQILSSLADCIALTKECLGVTDAQMGNIQSENTSAIMVMQQNAEVPLENIRYGMYEFIEDIAQVLLDMMATYYGERPISMNRDMELMVTEQSTNIPIMNEYTGIPKTTTESRRVMQKFDFTRLKHLFLNVRVDVGTSTAYSEIAMTQTLDNLMANGLIDDLQYLERIPDKLVPMKQDLIDQKRMERQKMDGVPAGQAIPDSEVQAETQPIEQQINSNKNNGKSTKAKAKQNFGSAVDSANAVAALPSNVQAQFNGLSKKAQNALARSVSMKTNASK